MKSLKALLLRRRKGLGCGCLGVLLLLLLCLFGAWFDNPEPFSQSEAEAIAQFKVRFETGFADLSNGNPQEIHALLSSKHQESIAQKSISTFADWASLNTKSLTLDPGAEGRAIWAPRGFVSYWVRFGDQQEPDWIWVYLEKRENEFFLKDIHYMRADGQKRKMSKI